jgi:SAM-dependent methyltransferase
MQMHDNQQKTDIYSAELESMLEGPTCPLCQEEAASPLFEGSEDWMPDGIARALRFSVVRCVSCGACYTSPRFREASKHLSFVGSYPFYQRARRDAGTPTKAEGLAFELRARQVTRFCPRPGKILDLGMGDGVFLDLMRQRGWQTAGVDSEADVVTYAREQLGLDACVVADVEGDPLPQGPFDVVTMWGLLQLTYRPQQFLEKVRTVLSPEGVIAIGVSNISSAGAWLFGSHWRGLGLPRHLTHFDPESLRRLVERAGFQTVDIVFETPYWIVAPSVTASLPLPGILGKIARRSAHIMLSLAGRTRLGDTMILLARVPG